MADAMDFQDRNVLRARLRLHSWVDRSDPEKLGLLQAAADDIDAEPQEGDDDDGIELPESPDGMAIGSEVLEVLNHVLKDVRHIRARMRTDN